jgi:TPR repeat protein
LHEKGFGANQDFVLGYLWYNLAAARGFAAARTARDMLSLRMTPAQIAEGQGMSRRWQPQPVKGSEIR